MLTRTFKAYTIEQFEELFKVRNVLRTITHIQIHHTWRPRKTDYVGEKTIYAMWKYHTETNKWQDIGQHFSVAPDGLIWDGRSLELNPAGISGHNTGGIMFEIIGDFDQGQEQLEGKQLYAVTRAVAVLLKTFNLSYDAIVFHREHASKTCPGTGISKEWFVEMVKRSGGSVATKKKQTIDGTCKIEYKGKQIEGIIIDGVSYAPVRKIGELQGLQVGWEQKTSTVKLE